MFIKSISKTIVVYLQNIKAIACILTILLLLLSSIFTFLLILFIHIYDINLYFDSIACYVLIHTYYNH